MKRAGAKKMYNSITDIRDEFTEEAQTVRLKRRSRSWVRWCAVAACLCLIVGVLFLPKGSQIEVKEIESLEEITASYGGNLLVERLASSGATTNSVRLSYAKGGDASDPAAWNTLSITGDYNGQGFTLDCNFDSDGDKKDPTEAYTVTQYGDVEVAIYQEESDWSDSYLYRADFVLDGVTYNLSIHSDSLEDIFAYLDMILEKQESGENPSGAKLTDVLGFDVCHVEMEEISSYQYKWHYYVEMEGEDICVAEQFGYDEPEAWSRDLDGDGVPELICNNTYGDGAQKVIVYHNRDGVIEEGNIRWSYYEEKFGWTHIGEGGASSFPVEQYNPEQGVFTATDYYTNGYDNPVTVEFDDGMEPFDFLSFNHLP